MRKLLQALALTALVSGEAQADSAQTQAPQGKPSIENYEILLDKWSSALSELAIDYSANKSVYWIKDFPPEYFIPSHYDSAQERIRNNLITCATHIENLKRYETLSKKVQDYKVALESEGLIGSLEKSVLSSLVYQERMFQIHEKSALTEIRNFPVNCESVVNKGQLQEDKLLVVPEAVYDTFTTLRIP